MVASYLSKTTFVLRTDSEGRFISAELKLDEIDIGQDQTFCMAFTIKKGFDKDAILAEINELVNKCEKKRDVFKLNAENYEWFGKAYQEQFKDVEFDYIEEYTKGPHGYDYDENGNRIDVYYPALVSKQDVSYKIFDDEGYWRAREEYYSKPTAEGENPRPQGEAPKPDDYYVTIKGKLVLSLSELRYYYVSGHQNEYGLGSLVGQDEYAVTVNSDSLINYGYITFTSEQDGGTVDVNYELMRRESYYDGKFYREEGLHSYTFLYSFSTDKITNTTGNYSYLDVWNANAQYSVISEKEYYANTGYRPSSNGSDTIREDYKVVYYRRVNGMTGEVSYGSFSVYNSSYSYSTNIAYVQVLSPDMNDEALEHSNLFGLNVYYNSNGTFEYRPTVLNGLYIEYDYGDGSKDEATKKVSPNWESSYLKYQQADGSFKVGNVEIKVEYAPTACACTYAINYSVKVGNEVLKSGSYTQHFGELAESVETVSKTISIDSCHDLRTVAYKCGECGKSYYGYSDYMTHHSYSEKGQVIATGEATNLLPGYEVVRYDCENCDEYTFKVKFDYPCSHSDLQFDDKKGEWVCADCGFSIGGTADEKPLALFEELNPNDLPKDGKYSWNEDRLAYVVKFIGEDYPYTYDTFGNYDFYMAVVAEVEGEDGEKRWEAFAQTYMYNAHIEFPIYYEGHYYGYYDAYYIYMYQEDYPKLLENAKGSFATSYSESGINVDDVDFYYAIVVLPRGQATPFMFILKP